MIEKNYYKEAEDSFRAKREAAKALSDSRRSFLHERYPEIKRIDDELSKTAVRILSAISGAMKNEDAVAEIRKNNEELRLKRAEILRREGYPEDYSDIVYDCPHCADSGFVGINMCSCMRSEIAESRLRDSELGRLSETQSFESFDLSFYKSGGERELVELNFATLKNFADTFSSKSDDNYLLIGATGLGKTHLSTALGVAVIRRGYNVVYKTIQSVIDDFEQVQFRGESQSAVRKYYECDLLIVDDLGAELTNQFTLSCLYNIINTRMNKRKPTVFSTNLNSQELRDRYADRITSRLFGEYKPLVFKGTDIRRQRLARK